MREKEREREKTKREREDEKKKRQRERKNGPALRGRYQMYSLNSAYKQRQRERDSLFY